MLGRLAIVSSLLRHGEIGRTIIRDILGRSLGGTFRRLNRRIEFGRGARGLVGSARAQIGGVGGLVGSARGLVGSAGGLVGSASGLVGSARGLVGGARPGLVGICRAHVGSASRRVGAHGRTRFPGAEIERRRDIARLAAGSGQAEF